MIDVLVCASGADEVQLVSTIAQRLASHARVLRRCVDLTELLALTRTELGDVLLLDVDVEGLSREVVHEIRRGGTGVIAITSPASRTDPATLGITLEAHGGIEPEALYELLMQAGLEAEDPDQATWTQDPDGEAPSAPMMTVWGPGGAPGRSFVAAHLAHELSLLRGESILIDADTYGPCLTQLFGVLDEVPGLVAACRASDKGALTPEVLLHHSPLVSDDLHLLSGIGVPSRYIEVYDNALEGVFAKAREASNVVVADVAGPLESDSGSSDYGTQERNGATRTALAAASHVLAVVAADPISVTRFVREAPQVAELTQSPITVVVNKLDSSVTLASIERTLRSRLDFDACLALPLDAATVSRARWDGVLLAESAPKSKLRQSLTRLTAHLHHNLFR
ncbi:pilus assembly protein CpaE [Dermabacter vaginalis]|uniref:AAA family ATPase n=1 Tax=Dermabacter vaginalis TaxID=1630135 RepID=UPI0021A8F49D|nr:pilus assembly protein CpaE [Dermabacter vaginalis]MCT2149506.1 pilus assembly protein CpaE [Dermabacter vaginalis]